MKINRIIKSLYIIIKNNKNNKNIIQLITINIKKALNHYLLSYILGKMNYQIKNIN